MKDPTELLEIQEQLGNSVPLARVVLHECRWAVETFILSLGIVRRCVGRAYMS